MYVVLQPSALTHPPQLSVDSTDSMSASTGATNAVVSRVPPSDARPPPFMMAPPSAAAAVRSSAKSLKTVVGSWLGLTGITT